MTIRGVTWSGWILGEGDVWVLEEREHAPDEVLLCIPEHRFLHIVDDEPDRDLTRPKAQCIILTEHELYNRWL